MKRQRGGNEPLLGRRPEENAVKRYDIPLLLEGFLDSVDGRPDLFDVRGAVSPVAVREELRDAWIELYLHAGALWLNLYFSGDARRDEPGINPRVIRISSAWQREYAAILWHTAATKDQLRDLIHFTAGVLAQTTTPCPEDRAVLLRTTRTATITPRSFPPYDPNEYGPMVRPAPVRKDHPRPGALN